MAFLHALVILGSSTVFPYLPLRPFGPEKSIRREYFMVSGTRFLTIDSQTRFSSSPYLFGHNLEHTRACISGGLSAQLLRNRKFAGRPSARSGVSAEWFGIGERVFFCNDQDPYVCHYHPNKMWRRNELNAQTVQNPIEGQTAGLGQASLFLKAHTHYQLAFVVKCSHPVLLTIALTDRSGLRIYTTETRTLENKAWQRYELSLSVPCDDPETCLRFTFSTCACLVFGSVSLLPEDHFHGMRRDVIEQLKKLGVGMLRWPGGNFAGEYRWQDMFLPVDMRAPLQAFTEDETQPYTHGYDMHEIDTDTFLALCREIGAEPFITINLAWDSPELCAAWVEYCNGSPDSKYGRLRAERGHAEPYHVRFWSLGNEMGYGHMEGPMQPDQYAALGLAAAQKMLQICPDLELCSSGPYAYTEQSDKWIEHSAKSLYPSASWISFHTYNHFPHTYTSPEGIRQAYETAIAAVKENRESLEALREKAPDFLHISYDEWNLWASWFRKTNALEGMFTASMLHMMLYAGSVLDVPVMCYFQPIGEGAVDVLPDHAELSANGQVFNLLKVHKGCEICSIHGLDDYEAVASIRDGVLSLSLINSAFDTPETFSISPCGQCLRSVVLMASDLLPGSHFVEAALDVLTSESRVTATLPPRSISLIQFRLE